MNPAQWLLRAAILHGDRPALVFGMDLVADYAGFAARAADLADRLAQDGVRAGDRVAVVMKNSPDYLVALYAIWWAGAVAVPVNAKLHAREVAWILGDAGAKTVIATASIAAELADLLPDGARLIEASGESFTGPVVAAALPVPPQMGCDDLVWLFYTSGTTGRPKGVMITTGNILAMIAGYQTDLRAHSGQDATIYAAPMSHGAGLYNFLFVLAGARHVVPRSCGFEPAELLDLARQTGRAALFAAPTMVRRLTAQAQQTGADGTGLDLIIYGGGPMYLADLEAALAQLGDRFAQIYGQGECPMAITVLPQALIADQKHPDWRDRARGVGHAQAVSRVAVVDETGAPLPLGETGEIVVQGPAVMKGYWRNADATAAALRDGWLWTGDMGVLDAKGFLQLVDRSKDVIISGGSNIYPREVEEVLLSHPDIAEVAVVGRSHPEWGEEVVACLVPEPGRNVDAAALDALCLARIARFKRPRDYVVLQALPKNNYGKVLKTALRRSVVGKGTDAPAQE